MRHTPTGPDATVREETIDTLFDGAVRLFQHRRGYRFSIDAVLLAAFAVGDTAPGSVVRMLDLGAGCGVVGVVARHWRPAWNVTAIEVQPELAVLARRNAAPGGNEIQVVEADARTFRNDAGYDLIVSNPPFYSPAASRPCLNKERTAARQEHHGNIEEILLAARRLLHVRGTLKLVYSAGRLPVLLQALSSAGMGAVRLRPVHARPQRPAHIVLVEAAPESRSALVFEPALVVHTDEGRYSPEVAQLLAGTAPVPACDDRLATVGALS